MKKRTIVLLASLTIASASFAQQPPPRMKQIRVGGGGVDIATLTKDWPQPDVKSSMSDADVARALGAYLDALAKRDLFSGNVLVAHGDTTLFAKSYGAANKDFNVPNTADTRFNLGSISKDFTRTAIDQLVKGGKLTYDTTLATVLPDVKIEHADRITIRQLLDHQSGMGDFLGPDFAALPKDSLNELRDFLPLFESKPLEFEPGKGRRYSNAGYIVLGLVIEKLSGTTWRDYVRTNIFEPLGMTATGNVDVDAVVPNRAVGYSRGKGTGMPLHSNVFLQPRRGSSAGETYSTTGDLLKFSKFLRTRVHGDGPVGFGIAGGLPGANAVLELADDYTIIVLANYDPPVAEVVATSVRKLLGKADS